MERYVRPMSAHATHRLAGLVAALLLLPAAAQAQSSQKPPSALPPAPAGALAPATAPAASPSTAPAVGLAQAPGPVLIAPDRLRQGDPLLAWLLSADAGPGGYEARLEDEAGKTAGTALSFEATAIAPGPKGGQARLSGILIPIPMGLKAGAYRLVVRSPRSVAGLEAELVHPIGISARSFPFEQIPLSGANAELLQVPDPRKDAEARKLQALLSQVDPAASYLGPGAFAIPVDSKRRTSGFGDRRLYTYASGGSDSSVHQGIDFAVPQGGSVLACARGKVVFAAERIVTGNTVVIEHLPGLFSIYMHLSILETKEGQLVEAGQRIAASGSTGLSTGPHLHWELRASGQAVDPEYWLSRPPLDNDLLIAKMTGLIEGR